jgi:hypothetical protein
VSDLRCFLAGRLSTDVVAVNFARFFGLGLSSIVGLALLKDRPFLCCRLPLICGFIPFLSFTGFSFVSLLFADLRLTSLPESSSPELSSPDSSLLLSSDDDDDESDRLLFPVV